MQREDLKGSIFGKWIAIEYAGDRKWLCECQCELHTRKEVSTTSLKQGRSTCCGLCNKLQYDLTGMQFGELKVIRYIGKDNKWLCECSCGAMIEKRSKSLRNGLCNTCGNQHVKNMQNKLQTQPKMQPVQKIINNKPKTSTEAGDWTIIKKIADRRYICKCTCGYTTDLHDSSIWYARINNYKCKHKKIIGEYFGELEVLDRITQKECLCKCHRCGVIKIVLLGNLLNGTTKTCGCLKTPTYTREQIIEVINKYMQNHNGSKPQPLELKTLLSLGETAIYENIKRYRLEKFLETHQSLGEKQVAELFEGENIIRKDRSVLNGLELDIYLPDRKLAVEFNGSFWHSDEQKDRLYHQRKTIDCARKGIHLIHIFDYEWKDNLNRIKLANYINRLLNKCESVKASDLQIQEIKNGVAGDFHNKYNFKNWIDSEINIALIANNIILSIMSFNKVEKSSGNKYEITRYCNKDNIIIEGGTTKIIEYFINKYHPQYIKVGIDISKFTGNGYIYSGFKPLTQNAIIEPEFIYVDTHLNIIDNNSNEEFVKIAGFVKVYDSGKLILEWKNKN